jgi:hypothetical protein
MRNMFFLTHLWCLMFSLFFIIQASNSGHFEVIVSRKFDMLLLVLLDTKKNVHFHLFLKTVIVFMSNFRIFEVPWCYFVESLYC